jgi:3'-phosphoadenosine 5'-phosphosulfate sulfotransferase (PAPS reductase)/FAD synthetase
MATSAAMADGQGRLWLAEPVAVRLADYDRCLASTSAGKDSSALLAHLVACARGEGVLDRLVAVHADLGAIEWPGTRELAERQARALGVPRFEVVQRERDGQFEDLLGYLLRWRKWPADNARWCTAALKRGPIQRLITRLADEVRQAQPGRTTPVRVLDCLGLRAAESSRRRRMPPLERNQRISTGRKDVVRYLPLHDWSTAMVWAEVDAAGLEHHVAYQAGQSRASCVLCFYQSPAELANAARHQPELAQLYELAEVLIGHDFRADLAMRDVLAAAGIAPLPRGWPLEAILRAAPDGRGTELALAVLRGQRPMPALH